MESESIPEFHTHCWHDDGPARAVVSDHGRFGKRVEGRKQPQACCKCEIKQERPLYATNKSYSIEDLYRG